MPRFLERYLPLTLLLLAGLLALVALVARDLGGAVPELRLLPVRPMLPGGYVTTPQLQEWFSPASFARLAPGTNFVNPFHTLFFQPPPPSPTKPVELTYIGCVETSMGRRLAYLQIGGATLIMTNGSKVVADHVLHSIDMKAVILTNAQQTNVLPFNVKRVLQVPAS
jgi:hypothetical protein